MAGHGVTGLSVPSAPEPIVAQFAECLLEASQTRPTTQARRKKTPAPR